MLGAPVIALTAKPAFKRQERAAGALFIVMGLICPLVPVPAATRIRGLHRRIKFPGRGRAGQSNTPS